MPVGAPGGTALRRARCHHGWLAIRWPIQRITGTAIELPKALYRGPSAAGLPQNGIAVQPSGNPCRRSHSIGVSLRTPMYVRLLPPLAARMLAT